MPEPKVHVKKETRDIKTGKVMSSSEGSLKPATKAEAFGNAPKRQLQMEKTVTSNIRMNDGTTVHATSKPWGDGREEIKEIGVTAPKMKMMKRITKMPVKKWPKEIGSKEEDAEEGQENNTAEQKRALKNKNMFGL